MLEVVDLLKQIMVHQEVIHLVVVATKNKVVKVVLMLQVLVQTVKQVHF